MCSPSPLLCEVKVGAFNSVAVVTKGKNPLAFIKAKFFRPQEFDRRVKEEGFVSFTSFFEMEKKTLKLSLNQSDIPRIMFIDTTADFEPGEHALNMLSLLGWEIFFDYDELVGYLQKLSQNKSDL